MYPLATERLYLKAIAAWLAMLVTFTCVGNCIFAAGPGTNANSSVAPARSDPEAGTALQRLGAVPAQFVANRGQVSCSDVRYVLCTRSAVAYVLDDGVVCRLSQGNGNGHEGGSDVTGTPRSIAVKMSLSGARKTAVRGGTKLPGVANYFRGTRQYTSVPTFQDVTYKDVYDGIDMVLYGSCHGLKFEFRLAPGADPGAIRINWSGVDNVTLADSGDMQIRTAIGDMLDGAPRAYQDTASGRRPVNVSYRLNGDGSYGFAVTGNYDKSLPLVIDPDLSWSSFLGGSGTDMAKAVAVDSSGNVYVTGYTQDADTDFPATVGAYDTSHNGGNYPVYCDVFVSKLNSSGSSLTYSTFIGGGGDDVGYAIAVDSSGNAYVAGECDSGFPTTNGAYDTSHNGSNDVFVVKLNSTGSSLSYSTFIGGSGDDRGYGIAVDGSGDIYVTGITEDSQTDMPTTQGAYDTSHNGDKDAFVVKLSPDGSGSSDLLYSTFIGGSGADKGQALAEHNGDAYITGFTDDAVTDWPTTAGAYDTSHNGDADVFVARISPDGSGSSDLVYSTLLGGSGTDRGHSIGVDTSGDAYVTGETADAATDLPTTNGAYDTSHNGGSDVFVARISPDGNGSSDLVYSTFIGGSSNDYGYGVAVNGTKAYVTGETEDSTTDFPTTAESYDPNHNGGTYDAFVCRLSGDGTALAYSTFLGGNSTDCGAGIAVVSDDVVAVTGNTNDGNTDFPTTSGAYDETHNGGQDVFVCKLNMAGPVELNVTVTTVRVYASASYPTALTSGQVHFDQKDATGNYAYPNVYIEIDATGGDSGKVDEGWLYVSSDSDTTGIKVTFRETGANTNTYRTVSPIHLAAASNQGTLELKVLEEEPLSVDGTDGVKVDRGEVATIDADFGGGWVQSCADAGADAVDEFLDKDEGSDPDPYCWWDGGDERAVSTDDTGPFPAFIKNVGNTSVSYPADILFECSHGTSGGIGYGSSQFGPEPNGCGVYEGSFAAVHRPNSGETPTIESTDWTKDIEWAVFYSCNVLGQDGDPDRWTRDWDDALIRGANDNNCHGILASSDPLWIEPTETHLSLFCEAMKGNSHTVIDAWMESALDCSPQQWPASALFHDQNKGDYLNNVTPETNDPNMYYTWYTEGNSTPNEEKWGAGSSGPDAATSSVSELTEIANLANGAFEERQIPGKPGWITGLTKTPAKLTCGVPAERPTLSKVKVLKQTAEGKPYDQRGFDKAVFDRKGRVLFRTIGKKDALERRPRQIEVPEAQGKAEAFVRQRGGGMPQDASLAEVRNQMVMTYDAKDPEHTRQIFVRKTFLEYGHKVNGIEIARGACGDSILVGLEGDEVVRMNRHWRSVDGPIGESQQVIPASKALAVAVENIPKVVFVPPTGYSIDKIQLFYYGLPSEDGVQELAPAWGFLVDETLWVYVDAFTGEFLK